MTIAGPAVVRRQAVRRIRRQAGRRVLRRQTTVRPAMTAVRRRGTAAVRRVVPTGNSQGCRLIKLDKSC